MTRCRKSMPDFPRRHFTSTVPSRPPPLLPTPDGGASRRPAASCSFRRFRDLTVEDVMAEAGLARTVFARRLRQITVRRSSASSTRCWRPSSPRRTPTRRTARCCARQLALAVRTFRSHGPAAARARRGRPPRRRRRGRLPRMDQPHHRRQRRADPARHGPWAHAADAVAEVARALTAMNGELVLDLVRATPPSTRRGARPPLDRMVAGRRWPAYLQLERAGALVVLRRVAR